MSYIGGSLPFFSFSFFCNARLLLVKELSKFHDFLEFSFFHYATGLKLFYTGIKFVYDAKTTSQLVWCHLFFHRPWVLFCIFSYRFFSVSKSRVTPVENHCPIYLKSVICYSTDSSVSRTPMMCLEAPLVPALQWKIFISYCKIWMWTDYELPSTGIWRKANRWEIFLIFWKHFVF